MGGPGEVVERGGTTAHMCSLSMSKHLLMSTAIFVACAAQKRKLWVGPVRGLFARCE